jgi:carboxylesterase type B
MPTNDVFAPVPPAPQGAAPAAPFRWGPVVDGYALPASIGEIFAAGRQNDVVTMTGGNTDESGASPQPTATVESFTSQAAQRYGDDAAAFLELYAATSDAQVKVTANASARDVARVSMWLWAIERAKTATIPAYTYHWTHPLPGPDVDRYGAFHTSEVPYLLNTLSMSDRPFSALDHRIADLFSTYIVNFASTGDPNGGGLPEWTPADADTPTTMRIGADVGMMPVASSPAHLRLLQHLLAR